MAHRYTFHPLAQEEYQDSISWYLKRSFAAGKKFVDSIDNALEKICADPMRYRNEFAHYREFTLQKYPFTIVYSIEESLKRVIIIAVYHHKRDPQNIYR